MSNMSDPFWQAAAHHATALGVDPGAVFAPAGFEPLLPGCKTAGNAPDPDDLAAVILHKGRLAEVPPNILLLAVDNFPVTFANEVFLVLARSGDPVSADSPHIMTRDALLAAALRASHSAAALPSPSSFAKPGRMAATYVGAGRVLLETAFGHLMLVDGADTGIAPHLIRDGWFDRNLTLMLGSILQPGMTFIDIGANFGTYTLVAAARVGELGRVIAIEPAPAIAGLLFENVTMNGFAERCDVLRHAVGARNGTETLYEFATRQGSNTMFQHIAAAARADYGETITGREVDCRTLDAIVADLAVERIDCIKIDVEGFEHQVLLGARETLLQQRPRLILEWHSAFFDGRKEAAHALYDLLTRDLRYGLHRIEADANTREVTLDALMELGHSDLLAVPLA